MDFRIAISFGDSLSRLTSDEQQQVKLTVFDLQQDPSSPGQKFHKLGKARDSRFWSVTSVDPSNPATDRHRKTGHQTGTL